MGKVSKATKKFQKNHLGAAIKQRRAHKRKKQQEAARGGPCTEARCRSGATWGRAETVVQAGMHVESAPDGLQTPVGQQPPPAVGAANALLLSTISRLFLLIVDAASKRPAGEGHSSENDEQEGKPRKPLEDMSIDEFLDGGFLDVAAQSPAAVQPSDDESEDEGGLLGRLAVPAAPSADIAGTPTCCLVLVCSKVKAGLCGTYAPCR